MFDRSKQLFWSKLKVGIVVTAALGLLFFTVFFAGGLEKIFSPTVSIKAQCQDVKGLRKGAPVWLSGIEIGSVSEIHLHPEYGTLLTLQIKKSALPYVKKDSTASVLTKGLLGDKYVEIASGTPGADSVQAGDLIWGVAQMELKDIVDTSARSIGKLTEFIDKLQNLVTKIERGEGTIARFLEDPSLYDNLKSAARDLSQTAREVRTARGTVRMLIDDPALYHKMVAASTSLEEFSRKMNESSGTLRRLLEDPSLYDKLLSASSSMETFGKKLNEGSGTLRMLAEDPALYENLSRASLKLTAVLERIEKGEGLAGTLVSDKEFAKDLKEAAEELRLLTRDVREHPTRYFKFSLF